MAIPVLRRPKTVQEKTRILPLEKNYVILTMKAGNKLVVTSDSYNGILSMGDVNKCVFCDKLLSLDQSTKNEHIASAGHRSQLDKHPHMNEFHNNLIRELTNTNAYCTLCNVLVANHQLMRHTYTEAHLQELDRAGLRANTYKGQE